MKPSFGQSYYRKGKPIRRKFIKPVTRSVHYVTSVDVSKIQAWQEASGGKQVIACIHTHAGTYTDCMDNFLVNIPIKGNLNNLADIDFGSLNQKHNGIYLCSSLCTFINVNRQQQTHFLTSNLGLLLIPATYHYDYLVNKLRHFNYILQWI